MSYDIDKGVPLPEVVNGAEGVIKTVYPFADMEIGDSFFVPVPDPHERDRKQNSILGTARRSKSCKGMHFTTRREEGGLRVWRIEPPASELPHDAR